MLMKTLNSVMEIKSLNPQGLFIGYASVFGILDEQGDRIAPGAFLNSLKTWQERSQMPKLLWQHKPSEPVGYWKQIREDKQGLYVEGQLLLDIQRAREAYALMCSRVLDSLSIGYRVVESYRCGETNQRVLTHLDLMEISLVTFAANPHARIRAVKSHHMDDEFYIPDVSKLTEILLKP